MMEALLVADDLDRHGETGGMVPTVQHLAERALAQGANHLVTISQVVTVDNEVVSSLVIVAMVVRWVVAGGWLLVATSTNAEDLRVVEDLLALEVRQVYGLTAFEDGCKVASVTVDAS